MRTTEMHIKVLALILIICNVITTAAYGEQISPTTGLPIPGELTSPMLVIISYVEGITRVEGRKVQAPGVDNRQVWGAQQADIIFESMLTSMGSSRLAFLYHDALVRGERVNAGPLRSVRDAHVQLADFWNAGIACRMMHTYSAASLEGYQGWIFDLSHSERYTYMSQVKGRPSYDNTSLDVTGVDTLMGDAEPVVQMWQFGREATNAAAIDSTVEFSWPGKNSHTTSFLYDMVTKRYSWYANGVPMKSWYDHQLSEESQLSFSNVIMLYADYTYSAAMWPSVSLTDMGEAVIWTGGNCYPAYWRVSDGQLRLVDERGQDMLLTAGPSYVAVLPTE